MLAESGRHQQRIVALTGIICLYGAMACSGDRRGTQSARGGEATDSGATAAAALAPSVPVGGSSAGSVSSSTDAGGVVTPATLTTADLDAYERGMGRENAVMQENRSHMSQAHNSVDTLSVVTSILPDSLEAVAAHDIGVPVEHYRQVVSAVNGILSGRQATGIPGQVATKIDTAKLSPEVRQQVRAGLAQAQQEAESADAKATASMAPGVAAALAQKQARLDSLRLGLGRQLMSMGRKE